MSLLGLQVTADPEGDTESDKGPVCFEVPSKYEITVSGKKLIGSAQMRRHGGVLQHGSLPLFGDIARICDVLAYESESARETAKISVRERAATLESAGLVGINWETAAAAIAEGMAKALDIELVEGQLSSDELAAADKLCREVYSSDEWMNKR